MGEGIVRLPGNNNDDDGHIPMVPPEVGTRA